jgi:hypothetical protein
LVNPVPDDCNTFQLHVLCMPIWRMSNYPEIYIMTLMVWHSRCCDIPDVMTFLMLFYSWHWCCAIQETDVMTFLPSAWREAFAKGLGRHIWPPPPSRLYWISGKVLNDMIWHEWHDLTWMTWFEMNDMIWHEWHDLKWMTWFAQMTRFDMNDIICPNDKIWHEWHNLTWLQSPELAMKAEDTVGAPTC